MKHIWNKLFFYIFLFFMGAGLVNAQEVHRSFIDLNGDGFHDYYRDSDIDGVPNAIDPDFGTKNMTASELKLELNQSEKGLAVDRFQLVYKFQRRLTLQNDIDRLTNFRFRLKRNLFEGSAEDVQRNRNRRIDTR